MLPCSSKPMCVHCGHSPASLHVATDLGSVDRHFLPLQLQAAQASGDAVQVKCSLLAAECKLQTMRQPHVRSDPLSRSAAGDTLTDRQAHGRADIGQAFPRAVATFTQNGAPAHSHAAVMRHEQVDRHQTQCSHQTTGSVIGRCPSAAGCDGDDMCVVCMDAPSVVPFSPCGHRVTCTQCAKNIAAKNNECPLCRCRIQAAVA